jgi:8-oxo-dGTP pyrophosphatase MutT (NUDIX family)
LSRGVVGSIEELATSLRATLLRDPPRLPPDIAGAPAAVVVPLVGDREPAVVFTRRNDTLSRHAGEISFPGGLSHPEDDGPLATALRENHEELGLRPETVEVLGFLDPLHTHVSGIWITPVVGVLEARPAFTPNPSEIAEVIVVSLAALAEVEAEVVWEREGATWTGFTYEVDGHVIWGATGGILHRLLEAAGLARREHT